MATVIGSKWFFLTLALALAPLTSLGQVLIGTISVGSLPVFVGVDTVTNMIYVSNSTCDTLPCPSPGSVTVINGATDQPVTTVTVGVFPTSLVVDQVRNTIYVVNECGASLSCEGQGTVSVIDGNTNTVTATVEVGYQPLSMVADLATNEVYVTNNCGTDPSCSSPGTVTAIDGANLQTQTIAVDYFPDGLAVNAVTDKIYVANSCGTDPTCNSNGTVTVIDAANNNTTTRVAVGNDPQGDAINTITNEIYVANFCLDCSGPSTVTVIDGANNSTSTVQAGFSPDGIGINQATNNAYISNYCNFNDDRRGPHFERSRPHPVLPGLRPPVSTCDDPGTVTVINGTSLETNINVGYEPQDVEVDMTTDQIYVGNYCGTDSTCLSPGTVSVINGLTNGVTNVIVGHQPLGIGINQLTDRIYVANYADDTVSVINGPGAAAAQFVNVTPCRLVDTRQTGGPIQAGTSRSFTIPQLGGCDIPTTAAAYSLNVTVVPHVPLGYLTIWPAGEAQPTTSLLNSPDGRTKANSAIVPAGTNGAVSVYVSNTTDVILDIDGYFTAPASGTYQFYPLTPCRLVDTRGGDGELGGPRLVAQTPRSFPLLLSSCIPAGLNPNAYSLNFTVIPNPSGQRLGYLTVWPTGEPQPTVSTLNNPTATLVANAAIVPAGTGGAVDVYPSATTDLLIDIDGYFAPAGTGGLSMYPAAPCRVLDTRQNNGRPFMGEKTVNVAGSACAPPGNAAAYIFNATVVPPGSMPYLTLWPDGEPQPTVSTLNAVDGFITSNMAIVPTTNGSIDAYAAGLTQLLLDISGYFAP